MNVNVTVLKDETLGGIEREYAEVKRKARVGERIKNTSQSFDLPVGYVTEVTGIAAAGMVEYVDAAGDERMRAEFTYVVLEPTDIVRVRGERLRIVDRKAAVNERVIIVSNKMCHGIERGTVTRMLNGDVVRDASETFFVGNDEERDAERDYYVLEPLTSAQPAPEPSTPPIAELFAITDGLTDAVAKLTRKVAELETRVKVTEEDVVLIESGVADEIDALKQAATKPVKELTRDDVIERAKADVAELQTKNHDDVFALTGCRVGYYVGWDDVKFVVNRDKRTVVALLTDAGKNHVWARGIAKAAPGDVFNTHIGRAIALRRALGLEVQAEYTSAPQPSEPRVGDIVEAINDDGEKFSYTVTKIDGDKLRGVLNGLSGYTYKNASERHGAPCTNPVVIDDSREEVAV